MSEHIYEIRPRCDERGFDLISDALPFGRLWYGEPNAVSNAIDYANSGSRSHDPVIRVYDSAGESDHADDGLYPQPILSIENDKWVGHGKVTAHAVFEEVGIHRPAGRLDSKTISCVRGKSPEAVALHICTHLGDQLPSAGRPYL